MTIRIQKDVLEQACKEIIETILFCLPDAYKGTVYRIGGPPTMVAKRITSGIIDDQRRSIAWGLPERSDYNPPGKPWDEYRDEPTRPLEAMAWCVERQRSWTAENPRLDSRSVRLQVDGLTEDYHHMEPVLVRKEDLVLAGETGALYPENHLGQKIWQDSEYVVAAVIKIHFRPNTIRMNSPQTKIIKKLSHSLGTELMSYQLREQSFDAMRQLAEDKIHSCNILADSLRNAVTKSGLIFSLIKLELGSLREQWEQTLMQYAGHREGKQEAIYALNRMLDQVGTDSDQAVHDLREVQNRFMELFLPPEQGENWIRMQIMARWEDLLRDRPLGPDGEQEVRDHIDELSRSLYLGKDAKLLEAYTPLAEPEKSQWTELIYQNTDKLDLEHLDRVLEILNNPRLNIPFREKSRKSLIQLKALAEVMGELEERTNSVLREVLNGTNNGRLPGSRQNR